MHRYLVFTKVLIFLSSFQVVFQITPLSFAQWITVMKFSLPVILLDELLKYVARNYADGKAERQKNWSELFFILGAITAYSYAWYLHELSLLADLVPIPTIR